jgi:hypothetical protein
MVSIVYTELVQFTDSAFSEAVDKLHRAIVDCMLSYKENVDQDILKKVKRKKKYSIVVVYILYCACQVPDWQGFDSFQDPTKLIGAIFASQLRNEQVN